ncbi:MAG: patatin-like phospholipase family protein [Proteobacteria bacterium]|nr:patatin-like phospholipase family protein [Pseudomonadota bacterium]
MVMFRVLASVVAAAVVTGGCASVSNDPVNKPLLAGATQAIALAGPVETFDDDIVVGLAFSGGGTRAAAFAFGVLQELDNVQITTRRGRVSLLDRVDFVTGVSGGAVTAAYFGLKQRAALDDFRERFLLRNAEESLTTDVNMLTLKRGLDGGINDATRLPPWLDKNLFEGATFNDLRRRARPLVWINASDIYNRTPFVFGNTLFGMLCSDLGDYPLSHAVAASAAVPIIFAPIVIQNHTGSCAVRRPEWIERLRQNEDAPPLIKTFADAVNRYQNGGVRYVKLLDGGLVDNYGLSAFTIARLTATTPYGPFSPREGAHIRRMIMLVVDAGRSPNAEWAKTVAGPKGVDLIMATADTTTAASSAQSYTAFAEAIDAWEEPLARWRCRLPEGERRKLGLRPGWNCRDVKFSVGRVSFENLGSERAAQLNEVETRLHLPAAQVDMVIQAGRDTLRANPMFREFLQHVQRSPRPAPPRLPPQLISSRR